MKSRIYEPCFLVPTRNAQRPGRLSSLPLPVSRPLRLLPGVCLLLILGWTIASLLLINMRHAERSSAETRARQAIVVSSIDVGADRY